MRQPAGWRRPARKGDGVGHDRDNQAVRAAAGADPDVAERSVAFAGVGDERLLAAIAGGDRDAFAVLVARHVRSMLALAVRVTRRPDEADEILQETLLKVSELAGRWPGEARFSTWLYRGVLNASLDRCRRSRGEASVRPDLVQARQRDHIIAEALTEIPGRQCAALALHYFADLSVPRVAEVMDLPVAVVETLLGRGQRALRGALVRRGVTGVADVT